MVDEVLTHLKELKATWEEAIRISTRQKRQNLMEETAKLA